jgi:hypothetical protein
MQQNRMMDDTLLVKGTPTRAPISSPRAAPSTDLSSSPGVSPKCKTIIHTKFISQCQSKFETIVYTKRAANQVSGWMSPGHYD